jgi:hypothetical protein
MSPLEADIRDSLRAEAERLGEVRPLLLPPAAAPGGLRRAPRALGPRWQRPWQAPVMAAAAIVLVAAALVTAKVMRNGGVVPPAGPGPVPATSAGPTADVTPRYYLRMGWGTAPGQRPSQLKWAIWAGDAQTGKTLGSYNLPNGGNAKGGNQSVWAASGAADDRTFAVAASTFKFTQPPAPGPARFYLFKVFPGSADPVRVTPLALQATPATAVATRVISIALSADGTELAVLSHTSKSVWLGVYSLATGRLQHFWSAVSGVNLGNTPVLDLRVIGDDTVTDLSWVGDGTVAFAFIQTQHIRQEVRTLDVHSAGAGLLTDSRVVWSQYVPPPVGGKYGKGTPQTCDTPFLTGNGQTVVCATSSYSASDKRLSARWLAYPLAPPDRPRVLGSVQVPPNVKDFAVPNTVDWTNSSGTEVIGTWNTETVVYSKDYQGPATTVTTTSAFIGGGQVRPLPAVSGLPVAW